MNVFFPNKIEVIMKEEAYIMLEASSKNHALFKTLL